VSRALAAAVFIALPTLAFAGEGEGHAPAGSQSTIHHVALGAVAGLGTPVGWGGLEAQVDALRWLALSAGAGLGLASGKPQLAAMAHLRWTVRDGPTGELALTGGYGMSRGEFVWKKFCLFFDAGDGCNGRKSGLLWWHNAQVALEFRNGYDRFPLTARAFAGVGVPANPGVLVCRGYCPATAGTGPLPFLGVSLGFFLR
jgi:hypothetical protein